MQSIRQVLEQLGIGGTGTATEDPPTAVSDAAEATDAPVATDGTTPADVPATNGVTATDAPDAAGPAPTARDVRHALHAFIHELFQTLSQGGSGVQAAGGPDGNGDNDGCATSACAPRSGYRNPGTDLPSLVQGAGTDGTATGGLDLSALTSRFQDLVQALGGDPADPAVTLQSFLQALLDQLAGTAAPEAAPATPPVGTLVATTA